MICLGSEQCGRSTLARNLQQRRRSRSLLGRFQSSKSVLKDGNQRYAAHKICFELKGNTIEELKGSFNKQFKIAI